MTKTFSIFFLFLALVSCGKSGGGGSNTEPAATDISASDEVAIPTESAPAAASTFNVNAKLTGFTKTQEAKIEDAIDLIKRVTASDEFKSKILNFKYNGKKQFVDNNGLTNAQIYQKILEASEKLTPGNNNTMDITLQTYYVDANVIGYTMASIKTIYMNTKYLSSSSFPPYKVAMNMTHEWLHKLGFGHDSEATTSRPYSVPYGIGYIMRDLAKKM